MRGRTGRDEAGREVESREAVGCEGEVKTVGGML